MGKKLNIRSNVFLHVELKHTAKVKVKNITELNFVRNSCFCSVVLVLSKMVLLISCFAHFSLIHLFFFFGRLRFKQYQVFILIVLKQQATEIIFISWETFVLLLFFLTTFLLLLWKWRLRSYLQWPWWRRIHRQWNTSRHTLTSCREVQSICSIMGHLDEFFVVFYWCIWIHEHVFMLVVMTRCVRWPEIHDRCQNSTSHHEHFILFD